MLTVDYDRLGVLPGDVVLDVGCGGGRHSFEVLRRGGRAVALDLSHEDLRGAAEMLVAVLEADAPPTAQAVAVQANALRLPFPDGSIDRVIASEVLEHIPADEAVMAELERVLKPGGTIAVTVPAFFPEIVCWALSKEYHSNEGGHVRIYRAGQLVSRLRRAGLEPTGSHHAHAIHAPYWWLRCAIGVKKEDALLARLYHRLLVWEITKAPKSIRLIDRLLNPLIGKSKVVYVRKPAAARPAPERVGASS